MLNKTMNNNFYPKRKPNRLKGYDYSTPGSYFITICTQNRKKLLSEIAGDGLNITLELTECGRVVDKAVNQISVRYPSITVDNYVIMPNHIHLLLSVIASDGRRDASPTVDSAMGWFKYRITKDINLVLGTVGQKCFQRSFHDHIVRTDSDYEKIWSYI